MMVKIVKIPPDLRNLVRISIISLYSTLSRVDIRVILFVPQYSTAIFRFKGLIRETSDLMYQDWHNMSGPGVADDDDDKAFSCLI